LGQYCSDITGGIGSSGILERFTTDYDLPNSYNYSESCASIGLALFGLRMGQITKESKYMDVAERALYNTVLAGIALDGKSFFYVNPLEVWPPACMDRTSREHIKPVRQKWFGVSTEYCENAGFSWTVYLRLGRGGTDAIYKSFCIQQYRSKGHRLQYGS